MTIKAYGKKASFCRKCNGTSHYVNKLGGISCLTCSPPTDRSPAVSILTIRDGVWCDANGIQNANIEKTAKDAVKQELLVSAPVIQSVSGPGDVPEQLVDLYLSDAVWGSHDDPNFDPWIMFKKSAKSSRTESSATSREAESGKRQRPIAAAKRKPLPPVGSQIELKRRVEMFGGWLSAGSATICESSYDFYGVVLVNLERGGRCVATGVML